MIRNRALQALTLVAALAGTAAQAAAAPSAPADIAPLAAAQDPHLKKAKSLLGAAKGKLQRVPGKGDQGTKALAEIDKAIVEVDAALSDATSAAPKLAAPDRNAVALSDQPRLSSSLKLLVGAEKELTQAAADKAGHRDKALEHVKAAVALLKAALATK